MKDQNTKERDKGYSPIEVKAILTWFPPVIFT